MFSAISIAAMSRSAFASSVRCADSNPLTGLRQQLTGCRGVTDLVSALEIEADPPTADMKPGAHAISMLGRAGDSWHLGKREPADAPERILDDLALECELPRILDMREHVSAASCLADGRPAIGRRPAAPP